MLFKETVKGLKCETVRFSCSDGVYCMSEPAGASSESGDGDLAAGHSTAGLLYGGRRQKAEPLDGCSTN